MAGFFDESEYKQEMSKSVKKSSNMCGACKLYKKCNTPKMEPSGKGKKGILIVSPFVTKKEDNKGHFIPAILTKLLRKNGIDIKKDCIVTSSTQCYSHKSIKDRHVEFCRPRLEKLIKKIEPQIIIPMGFESCKSVLRASYSETIGSIEKWHGCQIPDRIHNAWICPTFNASWAYAEKTNPIIKLHFEREIQSALDCLNRKLPAVIDEKKLIISTEDPKIIFDKFDIIEKVKPIIAFDFEATGLKPHYKGHRIVTCAIAYSYDNCIAFPLKNKKVIKKLSQILGNKGIPKIAANTKFEHSWAKHILGVDPENWIWDSMVASHILDNRQGTKSLDYQAYTNFGIPIYSNKVKKYLQSSESNDANSFNQIHKADLYDLLLYNGLDSLIEYRLAFLQMKKMGILDPFKYARTLKKPKVLSNLDIDFIKLKNPSKMAKRVKERVRNV